MTTAKGDGRTTRRTIGASPRAMLLVGAGGAAGAVARWGVGEVIPPSTNGFPWATLMVNLVGCALIGVAARRVAPATDRWLLGVTGGVGGFTTYSTFAHEARTLVAAGDGGLALAYVAVTVIGGVLAVEAGRAVAR